MPVRIYLSDLEKIGAIFTPTEVKKKRWGKILVSGILRLGDREFNAVFAKRLDGSQALYDIKGNTGKFEAKLMEDFMNTLSRSGLDRLKESFKKRNKYHFMINLLLVFAFLVICQGVDLFIAYQFLPTMLIYPVGGLIVAGMLLYAKSKVWKS